MFKGKKVMGNYLSELVGRLVEFANSIIAISNNLI